MVNYLLAAAVFCLVVTLSSAALVSTIPCTNGDECDNIEHSTCDTGTNLCKCDAAYKDGTGTDDGKCVTKGLGDPCDTSNQNGDCAAVSNAVCIAVSGTDKCACAGKYKESGGMCVEKGLGDLCDTGNQNGDCAAVSNAVCIAVSGTDKCACAGKYKESGGMCVEKSLGDPCGGAADCAGVDNSECATTCKCIDDFTAINNLCKKGLGNTCSQDSDCVAVTGATCNTECECEGSYKVDPADSALCKQKGLNDTCAGNEDCYGVSNAVCETTKCTCKITYKEENGQCNAANGLQTLLSAPIALLLSFLTIVVTRTN